MAGPDEAQARQLLGDMLERLSRGPQDALGISFTATHADVRSAFLKLTKQFHPARFARMTTEIQKLANEVFLGLRAAHDQLAKPAAPRAGVVGRAPTPPPIVGRTPTPPVVGRAPTPPPVVGRAPTPPPMTRTAAVSSDDRELAGVHQALQRHDWASARRLLGALAARAPQAPRYRALLAYTKGREAQLAKRVDEARVELQEALQLDPDLQLAKTALAELFTRRK